MDRRGMFIATLRQRASRNGWPFPAALALAFALIMSPQDAWAFSEVGVGLEQNATNPEKVQLSVPVTPTNGGCGADLSSTGGTGPTQYLKQAGVGANCTVGAIAAADLPSAIDAAKIADGSVSDTEFQYLNGVTSAIQTQLDAKLPLAGGTMTGQIVADNLGIEFEESDTNPTCGAGNFNIYADTSDAKLKKCEDGVTTDLDTDTGGSDTVVQGKLALRSSVKFSMGASATLYMALNGDICTAEADCRVPFEAGVFDNLTCLSTATQDANDVTVTLGAGACSGALTFDGATLDIPATASTSATATGAKTLSTGQCAALKITTGAGEAMANSYLICSLTVTGPQV